MVAAAVCVAGAVVFAACSSGPAATAPSTTTTVAPASTAVADPVEDTQAVLDSYRGMWADLVTAARTSDYNSPLLARHTSGDALTLFVQGLARDQLHGIVTKGEPVLLDPKVTSLSPVADPTHATVSDCVDDSKWVEFTPSGKRAKNPAGGRRLTTARLSRVSGTWKTTELAVGAVASC
jgi:hypothetical protein